MHGDEGISFFFGFLLGAIILGALVFNGMNDTSGTVIKIISYSETVEIVIINNSTDSEEILFAPKGMMQMGQKYSDIDYDTNHKVNAIKVYDKDE